MSGGHTIRILGNTLQCKDALELGGINRPVFDELHRLQAIKNGILDLIRRDEIPPRNR